MLLTVGMEAMGETEEVVTMAEVEATFRCGDCGTRRRMRKRRMQVICRCARGVYISYADYHYRQLVGMSSI